MSLQRSSPLVSVVVPTYQRAHVVSEAIASVLRQTHSALELLVVDDGSTDGTADIVTRFRDKRVRVVSIPHGGRSHARNEGVGRSRGGLVVFLDSDDHASPTWLEELLNAADDPKVAVVCCGAHVSTDESAFGCRATEIMPRPLGPAYSNRTGLFRAGTFAVRREVFVAIGGYDPRLAFSENSELAVRLAIHCDAHARSFAVVSKPLIWIRRRRGLGGETEWRDRLEATELMLERHGDWYRRAGAAVYAKHRAIAGTHAYRLGLASRAIRHFAAAVTANPGRPTHWGRLSVALVPPLARRVWRCQLNAGRASDLASRPDGQATSSVSQRDN